jgi:hypothetical protein
MPLVAESANVVACNGQRLYINQHDEAAASGDATVRATLRLTRPRLEGLPVLPCKKCHEQRQQDRIQQEVSG